MSKKKSKDGLKHDTDKYRPELLSPVALEQVAKVLAFGANKYGPYNWAQGLKYSRVLGALLRHVLAYMCGESNDPETGLSHIAHAMANCMFILHYEKFRKEFDDRPKGVYEISNLSSKSKSKSKKSLRILL